MLSWSEGAAGFADHAPAERRKEKRNKISPGRKSAVGWLSKEPSPGGTEFLGIHNRARH